MTTQISQQEIKQTAVRLGIPLDAEWAEKGGWYLNGIAVPTALVPQIGAFRGSSVSPAKRQASVSEANRMKSGLQ